LRRRGHRLSCGKNSFAQRLRCEELRIYRERLVDMMKRTRSVPFVQRTSSGCEM